MKPLKIGDLKLKNKLFLAPMVDITDLPYRLVCRKAGNAGCGMAYTEMVYIDALLHENMQTMRMISTAKGDSPLGLQITGNDPSAFKSLRPYLSRFDLVDINCGCPSTKLIGNEAGSFLLSRPREISKIIKILKSNKVNPGGIPITAKIRLGFRENNVLSVAKAVEKAGADAITVHARLAIRGYKTPADWKWIEKVKKHSGIPIIGNGDIFTGEDAKRMLEIADGAMLGRAAIGDPLVFSRILHYLKTGKEKEVNFNKGMKELQRYIDLSKKHDMVNLQRIKHIGSHFIRNVRGAAKLRSELMQLGDLKKTERFVARVARSELVYEKS